MASLPHDSKRPEPDERRWTIYRNLLIGGAVGAWFVAVDDDDAADVWRHAERGQAEAVEVVPVRQVGGPRDAEAGLSDTEAAAWMAAHYLPAAAGSSVGDAEAVERLSRFLCEKGVRLHDSVVEGAVAALGGRVGRPCEVTGRDMRVILVEFEALANRSHGGEDELRKRLHDAVAGWRAALTATEDGGDRG